MPDGSRPPEDEEFKRRTAELAASLDNAQPRPRRRRAADEAAPPGGPPHEPPPPDDDGGGGGDDDDDPSYFRVPADSPVQPLGIDGKLFLFIDANKQFVELSHKDFGGHGLSMLFGKHQDYLDAHWPRMNSKREAIGLDKEWAVRSFINVCGEKGVFSSDNKIRGVGAWTDADHRLIWHLGDAVLVVNPDGRHSFEPLGALGDHVYPQGAPQVRPNFKRGDPAKSIDHLYALLQKWAWKRGDLDARLQLGWIGCALIGGALRWRPATWATGGQGTGKSTLDNDVLNPVLGGDDGVVQTADATGPGLYQALRKRSTAVLFDELEPRPDNRQKVEATIQLARVSASGARIVRGSPDGTHREFVARAAFRFGSIHITRLEPQDAMRICVLDLQPLGDRKEPVINRREMLELGRDLRRRLVERWKWWPHRLEKWREKLREAGYSARIADTWGTLLAMADHLLAPTNDVEEATPDEFAIWIDKLKPHLDVLVDAAGSDHARLLQTLLTTTVDPYSKGKRWPLSTILSAAAQRRSQTEISTDGEDRLTVDDAHAALESIGMKLGSFKMPRPDDAPADYEDRFILAIAFANGHTEMNKLLRETKWGAGVYTQTLLRIPGAWSTQQRVARRKGQCAMVPLDIVLPPDGEPNPLLTP